MLKPRRQGFETEDTGRDDMDRLISEPFQGIIPSRYDASVRASGESAFFAPADQAIE